MPATKNPVSGHRGVTVSWEGTSHDISDNGRLEIDGVVYHIHRQDHRSMYQGTNSPVFTGHRVYTVPTDPSVPEFRYIGDLIYHLRK